MNTSWPLNLPSPGRAGPSGLPRSRAIGLLLPLAALLLSAQLSKAADWPRFRGPNGTGVADTASLPARFGPAEKVVWKTPLPSGHSSPIVSGDRIFLTAVEDEKLYTLCLSRADGKVLWRRECPRDRAEPLDKRNNPASPTPVADGRKVYVFFPDFGLISYDFEGHERWSARLGPFNNLYGMGASPIVVDDKVVLICDQSTNSFIIALGKDDGRVRWKTPRPEAISGHSTPVLYKPEDGPTQVIAPGSLRMDAYSAETGQSIWWVNGLASEMKSVPVLHGNTVFINGYNTPANDPGNVIAVPPFEAVLAARDTDKDNRIAREEAPEGRVKRSFRVIDLDRDGFLDALEWKTYRAAMAAENGLRAIRVGGRGDKTESSLLWKYQRSVPQLPSTLLYQNVLYMINDGGIVTIFDPSNGAVHMQARLRGAVDHYFASPVAGDGKIFFVSLSGVVTVAEAGAELKILSVNELGDECYATPALASGRIYIRTRGALYCFGRQD